MLQRAHLQMARMLARFGHRSAPAAALSTPIGALDGQLCHPACGCQHLPAALSLACRLAILGVTEQHLLQRSDPLQYEKWRKELEDHAAQLNEEDQEEPVTVGPGLHVCVLWLDLCPVSARACMCVCYGRTAGTPAW